LYFIDFFNNNLNEISRMEVPRPVEPRISTKQPGYRYEIKINENNLLPGIKSHRPIRVNL